MILVLIILILFMDPDPAYAQAGTPEPSATPTPTPIGYSLPTQSSLPMCTYTPPPTQAVVPYITIPPVVIGTPTATMDPSITATPMPTLTVTPTPTRTPTATWWTIDVDMQYVHVEHDGCGYKTIVDIYTYIVPPGNEIRGMLVEVIQGGSPGETTYEMPDVGSSNIEGRSGVFCSVPGNVWDWCNYMTGWDKQAATGWTDNRYGGSTWRLRAGVGEGCNQPGIHTSDIRLRRLLLYGPPHTPEPTPTATPVTCLPPDQYDQPADVGSGWEIVTGPCYTLLPSASINISWLRSAVEAIVGSSVDIPDTIGWDGYQLCIDYLMINVTLLGINLQDILTVLVWVITAGIILEELRS